MATSPRRSSHRQNLQEWTLPRSKMRPRRGSLWPTYPARKAKVFQHGLMAFQILKPVQTLGFIFQGSGKSGSALNSERAVHPPPTDAEQWARMRRFDGQFLAKVPDLIPKICRVMQGTDAEHKNSIILLQLGLEQSHPLIAGLLCIMGMEASFDSADRKDFEKKLCVCLGASTLVFPDWNSPRLSATQVHSRRTGHSNLHAPKR